MDQLSYSFKLVEGSYCPTESADVLLSLITDKIKFHNLQILCLKHRDNAQLRHAEKRLEELKATKKTIANLILKARDDGYFLKIDGTVSIEMLKIS